MATKDKAPKNEWQAADEAYEAAKNALVRMVKEGEELLVHPTTVKAHIAAGWAVVVAEAEKLAGKG